VTFCWFATVLTECQLTKGAKDESQNWCQGGAQGHANTYVRKEPTVKVKSGVKAGSKATPHLFRIP
jgi:hypothetical protein